MAWGKDAALKHTAPLEATRASQPHRQARAAREATGGEQGANVCEPWVFLNSGVYGLLVVCQVPGESQSLNTHLDLAR